MDKLGTFKFRCPSCGKSIRAPSAYVGRMIACPGCKANFAVPKDAPPSQTMILPGIEREEARHFLSLPDVPDEAPPRPPKPKAGEPTITYHCAACGHIGETGLDNNGLVFTCPGCGQSVLMPDMPTFAAGPPTRPAPSHHESRTSLLPWVAGGAVLLIVAVTLVAAALLASRPDPAAVAYREAAGRFLEEAIVTAKGIEQGVALTNTRAANQKATDAFLRLPDSPPKGCAEISGKLHSVKRALDEAMSDKESWLSARVREGYSMADFHARNAERAAGRAREEAAATRAELDAAK